MDLTAVREHYEKCLAKPSYLFAQSRVGEPTKLHLEAQRVGWKDNRAQRMRFNALMLLFEQDMADDIRFTVNDWGCGLGEFAPYIYAHCEAYHGCDISPKMIDEAVQMPRCDYTVSDVPTRIADYTVASGLFNVMEPGVERDYWLMHYLWNFNKWSRKGFAFNMLHARADRRERGLFYANPFEIVEAVKQVGDEAREAVTRWRFSVLQHYSPWDFTILVHK